MSIFHSIKLYNYNYINNITADTLHWLKKKKKDLQLHECEKIMAGFSFWDELFL